MRLPRALTTVSGQFVLLLVGALLIANVIAFAVFSTERDRIVRSIGRGAQAEQLASLAAVLARVPPDVRGDLTRAASSRRFRLSVSDEPSVLEPQNNVLAGLLRSRLEAELDEEFGAVPDVRVSVERHRRPPPRQHQRSDDGDDDRGPRRFGPRKIDSVDASIALPDGSWVNMASTRRSGPPEGIGAPAAALLMSLLVVAGAGIWFIRRLTRPIRALAEAADLAGRGDRTAKVPVKGPGEMRRAAAAFNGMQERIAVFDQERARTIAAVGHDLRTPITALRLRAEMVDEDAERAAMVRTLDEMKVIADGLLTFGQSAASTETVEPVDLSALLADIAARDPSLSFNGPAALTTAGRPVALARAFGNLASNAVRYGDGGRITLAATDGTVRVIVSDDGPGIDPARLDEVFEPFVRLEESRSAETGGAGLGLSIARTLIRAHGGDIALQNRAEGGLDAIVTLPLRVSPP